MFLRHHTASVSSVSSADLASRSSARRRLGGRPIGRIAGLAVACLALVTAGCADDDLTGTRVATTVAPTTIAPPADAEDLTGKAEVTVVVTDNQFTPRHMKISVGTKVTWVNEGENDHNVMSADGTRMPKMAFAKGKSVSFVFDKVEFMPYYCSVHGTPRRGQNGSIQVVE